MGAKKLSWCEYLERLQIEAEECETDKSHQEPSEVARAFPEYPLCQGYFHMCMPSDECESGTVCIQTRTRSKCCTAPHSRCPTVDQMGFTCRKKQPTNWCMLDQDCGAGPTIRHVCCPTGCNYNICLRDQSPVPSWNKIRNLEFAAHLMSPECPHPLSVPMNCVAPRPISWCYTQLDCPSFNHIHPRRCCPTSCGYNVCLSKYSRKWIIA